MVYLYCHAYILLWWFSLLLVDSHLVTICLLVCSQQLVVTEYYYYYCLSDKQQWQSTKLKGAGSLLSARSTDRDQQLIQNNMYMYVLYLRSEDTILAILCTGLPITTNIADQWLNSLIFHANIKCIRTNG